jgi:hypothetical protein
MENEKMNIFKILTSFGHRIPEDNYNDYLAYILNPIEEHGLGDKFLKAFISKVFEVKEIDISNPDNVCINREVGYEDKRYMDIEISNIIIQKSGQKEEYKICIECKTNGSSKSSYQLFEEYRLINDNRKRNCNVCLIYLTPYHKNFRFALNETIDRIENSKKIKKPEKDMFILMTWNKKDENTISVVDIIDNLPNNNKNKPKDKDILRHFYNHLKGESFSIKNSVTRKVGDNNYEIIQYSDYTVFIKKDESIVTNILGTLRDINRDADLRIDFEPNSKKLTTQQAAPLVIKKLKKGVKNETYT